MLAATTFLCGIITVGSVYFRIKTFDADSFENSIRISSFVYLSFFVGMLFTSYQEMVVFLGSVFAKLDPGKPPIDTVTVFELILTILVVHLASYTIVLIGENLRIFWIANLEPFWISIFIGTILSGGYLVIFYALKMEWFQIILFLVFFQILSFLNVTAGIVATCLSASTAIASFYKTGTFDFFSLFEVVEILPWSSEILSISILIGSSVVGALEIGLKTVWSSEHAHF